MKRTYLWYETAKASWSIRTNFYQLAKGKKNEKIPNFSSSTKINQQSPQQI